MNRMLHTPELSRARRYALLLRGIVLLGGVLAVVPGRGSESLDSGPVIAGRTMEVKRDMVYGRKANLAGQMTTLTLDLFLPPAGSAAGAPRPLVVLFHGGGFFGGDKEQCRVQALAYARLGFASATINYRLAPRQWRDASPENFIAAATQAVADGMDAIRFLKVRAAEFDLDPHRIATVGFSAGGWIALINAIEPDTFNGVASSYPAVSSRVDATISSGVSFSDNDTCRKVRDELLHFNREATPALLFHAETVDAVTTAPWAEAEHLARMINASGNRCQLFPQSGTRHTDDMSPVGRHWEKIQPFLAARLKLSEPPSAAATPISDSSVLHPSVN